MTMSAADSSKRKSLSPLAIAALATGALLVTAILIWAGVTQAGLPDPTLPDTGAPTAILNIALLVFREGLECVLVLAAITAGLMGSNATHRRPIGVGVIVGFGATVVTWFIAIRIIDDLTGSVSALSLQAWTGLLAIVVLLIVMNWFFHKVYWTGWISLHNRRKRSLLQNASAPGASRSRLFLGLAALGFASMFREGFEVVLFLQSYRLRMGDEIVLLGALIGGVLAGIVAVLTFVGHHRLPYKRMLIVTGALLVFVLIIMVGEQVNEMQLAGWIGKTDIPWLAWLPDWAGLWFSLFPNVETIAAQIVAIVLVLGSYAYSRYQAVTLPKKQGLAPYTLRTEAPRAELVEA
ncbi:MAG TPA: FTR1 family protein [Ktedonobacterales bacterium]|jgi:high-affinity iron transporter|nr:FTR1 family protein [Ktedonobacterales bacterium]